MDHNLDFDRQVRIGLPEAVYCEGKSTAQIDAIVSELAAFERSMLLTRLYPEKYASLSDTSRNYVGYDPLSFTGVAGERLVPNRQERVAIVAAGTSDAVSAREAAATLAFQGVACTCILDVGVAGLWRLTDRLDDIRRHDIVIAVAGMDAALVSVLGGLISAPLIAVPTSAGYGAARSGETALAASLASCASGIAVCNIDNGYGAACAALRILSAIDRAT